MKQRKTHRKFRPVCFMLDDRSHKKLKTMTESMRMANGNRVSFSNYLRQLIDHAYDAFERNEHRHIERLLDDVAAL